MKTLNLENTKKILNIITFICFVAQIFLINNLNDIYCLLILLFSNIIVINYTLSDKIFPNYPISSIVIFFSSFVNFGFVLYFRTIEQDLVTHDFKYPFKLFLLLSFYSLLFILAHKFYIFKVYNSVSVKRLNLWLINSESINYSKTFFYFCSVFYFILLFLFIDRSDNVTIVDESIFYNILDGFKFLFFAPIVIYYYEENKIKLTFILILLYGIISFGFNSMSALYDPIMIIFIVVWIKYLKDNKSIGKKGFFWIILSLIVAIFFLNQLNQLTYSYLSERQFRSERNFKQKVNSFIENLGTKNIIDKYEYNKALYDKTIFPENTYKNLVFNRLNTILISDHFLFLDKNLSVNEKKQMKRYEHNKIISLIPQPLINLFNNDFNKLDYKTSVASYAYKIVDPYKLTDKSIGSLLISLWIYYGYFSFLILFLLCIPVFIICDILHNRKYFIIHPLLIILLYRTPGGVINFLSFESLNKLLFFIIREVPQTVILYMILYSVFKSFNLNKFNKDE